FCTAMKKVFFKISSFLLAFLVLFSTVSFTVEKHFCGDFLVDTALFVKADSCGMVAEKIQSPTIKDTGSSACTVSKTSCCSDEIALIQGQDTLQKATSLEWQHQLVSVQAFVYVYLNLFEGLKENVIPFRDYAPPLVVQDIQVLHDTFLI
ncbi:HYC_CC_PP family protein, partial [Sinomicrobium oceani]